MQGTPASGLFRRVLREHVRPYLKWLAAALVFMALASGAQALSAWLMKPVVDDIFVKQDRDLLLPVALAVFATFLVRGVAGYLQAVFMAMLGQRVVTDLQVRLYDRLITLDLQFFQAEGPGRLVNRVLNDAAMVRESVSSVLTSLGKDTLLLIGLTVVMFTTDWLLGLISFVALPLVVYPVMRLSRRMRKVSRVTMEHRGELLSFLSETIQGVRLVRAYAMEGYERARMARLAERLFALAFKGAKVGAASSPITEVLSGAAITAVIAYGGLRVLEGATTAGSFFAFITAALMAYEPAKRLSRLGVLLQGGLAALDRLYDVLDREPSIVDPSDAKPLEVTGGGIRVESVDFAYDKSRHALQDLTLDVPAGKMVALVGPSGAGKSTVFNLILRFYDPESGAVTIDGQDLRAVTLASLRRSIALVSQDVSLFDDSVRANIAYGRPEASDAEIEAAARHAVAHDFITALPHGYDTMVGAQGATLSGGQRQRLAIARAMLKDAPILLLDEATSALDTESERAFQQALETLAAGRTTVVIAHRLSTVIDADLIHVIDQGRVVESGSHEELLAKGGAYARLYSLQFRDAETEATLATAAGSAGPLSAS